jgi:hypothetical protein
MYQRGGFALAGSVDTVDSVGSTTVGAVGISDEAYEQAIAAEFAARVDAYGGVAAYCADFGYDRRNFSRYLKGRKLNGRLVPNIPPTPMLLRHIANMGVDSGDFFRSVDVRAAALSN